MVEVKVFFLVLIDLKLALGGICLVFCAQNVVCCLN